MRKNNQTSRQHRSQSRSRSREDERDRNKAPKVMGRPKKYNKQRNEEPEEESPSPPEGSEEDVKDLIGDSDSPSLHPAFIDFFQKIKEEKGLVLPESERELLRKKGEKEMLQKYQWTPRHQWHESTEKEKIIKIGRQYQLHLQQSSYSWLYKLLFETSWIFSQQFTEEIYRILLNIYQILIGQRIYEQIHPPKQKKKVQVGDFFQKQAPEPVAPIETRLQKLAYDMCTNESGNYTGISFNFRTTKTKKKPRDEVNSQDKKKAYLQLVEEIKKDIQSKMTK